MQVSRLGGERLQKEQDLGISGVDSGGRKTIDSG